MNFQFSNVQISLAQLKDIAAITQLLNSAYRGESSRKGWTTEADLIGGELRTDEKNLQQVMEQAGSVVLKYSTNKDEIIGCVNLQQHGKKLYLGMFSVSPELQGGGIGRQLLQAAEEYAFSLHCTAIYMSVISVRQELIDWYIRNGYRDTGERKAFPEDGLTGKHLQPLEFIILEKQLVDILS